MKARLAAAIFIEFVLLLNMSFAQQPGPVADPDAERILDKAAQAEGGDSLLNSLRTLRLKGTMYLGPSHLLGDVESVIQFPDKFHDTFQGANRSTLSYGFDGSEPWTRSTGGQRSTGIPRLQLLIPAAQWRLRYIEARFLGQREAGKRRAYVIRARVRGQSSPADYYYDPDDYTLLQAETTSQIPQIVYRLSSFRDIDGLKVPREWSYGQNRTVIGSVKVNIDVDENQFAKPK